MWMPCLVQFDTGADRLVVRLGHVLVDDYLEFLAARARPNTVLAYASDLKVFFEVVRKDPTEVTPGDVLGFIAAQRSPRDGSNVVRLVDGEAGLSARTIRRRLSAVSGLYGYLIARGDAGVVENPVPRGLATRRTRRRAQRGMPLVRTPRTLPRVLSPDEVNTLVGALRTRRDRAMVEAMVLGGLRRSEVLGLRFEDIRPGERRVFVAEGKGGHQRLVPISSRFFVTFAEYLDSERPEEASTDRLFVVLKGPNRGQPLTPRGLDEVLRGARSRAGLKRGTCHELRHTCLTRLREAGMSLEALQAQAGHRSVESTRIYLHLADGWLADQYRQAQEAIDAQTRIGGVQ
jgi:site-specific recombinase XerD